MIALLLVASWAAQAPGPASRPAAQPAGPSLERAIAYLGGEDAIRAHRSQVMTSAIELDDGAKGRRISWVRCDGIGGGGGKAREELKVAGQVFVVGTDGKHTWRWSKTGALPAKSVQLMTSLRIACLGPLLLAARHEATAAVDAQGRLVIAHGPARLALTLAGSGEVTNVHVEEEGAPAVDVELTAWSPAERYPVARRLTVAVAGATTERRTTVSVGRNARLDDAMFAPPAPLSGAPPGHPSVPRATPDDDTIDL